MKSKPHHALHGEPQNQATKHDAKLRDVIRHNGTPRETELEAMRRDVLQHDTTRHTVTRRNVTRRSAARRDAMRRAGTQRRVKS